jgi:predicted esterase
MDRGTAPSARSRAVRAALATWVLALIALVASPARAQDAAAGAAPAAWCTEELVTLEGDVCFAPFPAASATEGARTRRTLVIFLHGLLDDGGNWQWPLQRGMIALARHHRFALLAPRGLNGVGPGRLPRQIGWPAREDVRDQEDALLAKIMRARREAEVREGAPYDEVFVFGFSNGAYYASSLALRGRLADVDGYAVFAGGSAKAGATAPPEARKPLFVGVASADRTTVQRSRELVKALARAKWPYRAMEAKVGHTVADAHVTRALQWLRARAEGLPDPPPAAAPPRSASRAKKTTAKRAKH